MPDTQVDRVIRSIEANNGTLAKLLARDIPQLAGEGMWAAVVAAVRGAFEANA